MRNLLKITTLLAFCALTFSSCLKDKGFENNEYGINLNDGSPAAVGFLRGALAKTSFGVDVDPGTQFGELVVSYTGEVAPSADVTLTLSIDNSLIAAYNTANSGTIQALPAAGSNVPTTFVIPAGQRFAKLKVGVVNTTVLNPNIEYGVGIRITAVSGGVKIASNLEKILVTFNIKNKYDGKYSLTFSNYHPSLNPGYIGSTTNVELITTGPNTVTLFWPLAGEFVIPSLFNGGFSYFGAQTEGITINPTTNKVTAVTNVDPGGGVVYTLSSDGSDHRYEAGPPKKIFIKFGYNNPGGVFVTGSTREWTQAFTYTGPR